MSFRRHEADRFAEQRLPDLPTAGYASKREKELTDAVMFFIRGAERDRLMLLDIVCKGEREWLKHAMKSWRYLRMDEQLCKAVFRYLTLLAGENPHAQLDTLIKLDRTAAIMDSVRG